MMEDELTPIVDSLLDSHGVCLVYRPDHPEDGCLPVLVKDGKVYSLIVGNELEPDGFEKDIEFDGPFLPNYTKSWK